MILFCGIPSEPPLAMAIAAAEATGVPHVIFNQREAPFADILLEHDQGYKHHWGGSLWVQETLWPLDGFTGIYARVIDPLSLPENQPQGRKMPDPAAITRSTFIHNTLSEWIEMAQCRVLNRAEAMASNGSKPYQAQWIQRAGFLTPPTLVTNDPELVLDFARRHDRVIYKSTSSIRSIVREFDPGDLANLALLHHLPTQFQARVGGTNIRVHVVGEKLFATEISSEAVDYRYAQRDGSEVEMRPLELPSDVKVRCLQLSKMLRLPLCGIDLMRTSTNQYYCFEVNSSPAYSYFEKESGQPISRAIVDYLSNLAE